MVDGDGTCLSGGCRSAPRCDGNCEWGRDGDLGIRDIANNLIFLLCDSEGDGKKAVGRFYCLSVHVPEVDGNFLVSSLTRVASFFFCPSATIGARRKSCDSRVKDVGANFFFFLLASRLITPRVDTDWQMRRRNQESLLVDLDRQLMDEPKGLGLVILSMALGCTFNESIKYLGLVECVLGWLLFKGRPSRLFVGGGFGSSGKREGEGVTAVGGGVKKYLRCFCALQKSLVSGGPTCGSPHPQLLVRPGGPPGAVIPCQRRTSPAADGCDSPHPPGYCGLLGCRPGTGHPLI